ncbi:hypothetical protein DLD77_10525 [Chitinophaga alhagiae]|uniref:Aminotransferase class I/classII large domain-containing protein n=1 Tax=Chitinophaga alhagiae TaxID=2203219 RepID=A0ABN5LWI7_9BACT|nr:aminotransferase class I/II-fold pyridoxal phosphate-dependent enzyme [Chitinophaga alhagiae]AWO02098.1 hypothetical protein DLD77_10525 [Chitinophaga alhagiae]
MLNLRLNYPSIPREGDVFQAYCQALTDARKSDLLHPPYQALSDAGARTVLQWLHAREGVSRIVPLPSANSGLYCILDWFRGKTPRIACEPFTFPGFKMAASHHGYELAPIASDDEGILPDALERCLQERDCKLVYLQPTVHNPTCSVMPLTRREAVANVIRRFSGVYILEDDAYRFLHPEPPPSFLQLLPEQTLHVYSLSKAFNPLLKSAYLLHPEGVLQGVDNIVRLTTSGVSLLFTAFGLELMNGQLLQDIIREKQAVGQAWHRRCEKIFDGLTYSMFPGSFHLWLQVPDPAALTRQLYTQQIDVPDGAEFAVGGNARYVRIALGTVWERPALPAALENIAELVRRQ